MEAVLIAAVAISVIAVAPIYIIIWLTIGKNFADSYFSDIMIAGPIGFIIGIIYFFIVTFFSFLFLENVILPNDVNLYFYFEGILDGKIYLGLIIGVCCAIGGATAMKLK